MKKRILSIFAATSVVTITVVSAYFSPAKVEAAPNGFSRHLAYLSRGVAGSYLLQFFGPVTPGDPNSALEVKSNSMFIINEDGSYRAESQGGLSDTGNWHWVRPGVMAGAGIGFVKSPEGEFLGFMRDREWTATFDRNDFGRLELSISDVDFVPAGMDPLVVEEGFPVPGMPPLPFRALGSRIVPGIVE